MSCEFLKSRFPGVRYREHPTRKNGIRKDRYFIIRYKYNGKDKNEGFGWESEGFLERDAYDILCEIKRNIKTGFGFFSLKEKREQEQTKREIEAEKNIVLNDFFDNHFLKYHLQSKSDKTKDNQIKLYDKHIRSSIGTKRLNDITYFDIEDLKNYLVSKKYAAASVNYIIGIIKTIFKEAQNYDFFDKKSPAAKVKPIVKDNRRERWLTKEEEKSLLNTLKNMKLVDKKAYGYDYYDKFETTQLFEISLISLDCGLRAKEICNLIVSDINFSTVQISIRDPKNKENRYVPMTRRVENILKQHIEYLKLKPNDLIFCSANGNKLTEISDQFYRIVDSLGFNDNINDTRQKVVFHTLRHTYASKLAQAGIPQYIIQKLLGHKTSKMTNRYSHLAPDNFKEAIAILEANND